MLAGCHDETLNCLSDDMCQQGTYCRATRCVTPGDDRALLETYTQRVVPLLETGCNCHGPASDRPWRFDHRSAAATEASLSMLRNWMYNPERTWREERDGELPDGGAPDGTVDRYALIGYATAACGLDHPQIWAPDAPQLRELALWVERAYDQIERPAPLTEPPEVAVPDGPLRSYEQALYEAAVSATEGDGGPAGFDPIGGYVVEQGRLAAALAGQCGCCHGPPLGFASPPATPEERVARGAETFCDVAPSMPFNLTYYALGTGGDSAASPRHPVVYSGADDPRYGLLVRWFEFVAARRAEAPDTGLADPCDAAPGPTPPDGGLGRDGGGDGGLEDEAVIAFMGPIGALVEQRCSAGGCHPASSRGLPFPYPFASFAAARGALAGLDALGLFDRARPEQSRLILVGTGRAPKGGPLPQPFAAGEVDALAAWIEAMPTGF